MQRHNLPDIQELMWQKLNADVAALKTRMTLTNTARERSEVTGGFANLTLATLPTVNNTGGDVYFASDGCKPGEATGHGTGTAVYWDATTSQWLRMGDYQPPSGGTPLPVSSGGTGASTLTTHAMLIGNGTSPILGLAPGANRNVSISNGTDWTSRALVAADMPAGIPIDPLTTKGDLWAWASADTRQPVGTDNTFLTANSAQPTGLQYRIIASTDLTTALTTPPPIGGSTPASITGTTMFGTSYDLNDGGSPAAYHMRNGAIARGDVGVVEASNNYATGAVAGDIVLRTATGNLWMDTNGGVGQPAIKIASGNGATRVRQGLATGTAALAGTIFDHFADAANSGTGATTLYSDSIPASALGSNGDAIRAVYFGVLASNINSKTLAVSFGGTSIYSQATMSSGGNWRIDVLIIRDTSTSVRCVVNAHVGNTVLFAQSTKVTGLTLTNANNLVLTGTGGASSDIVAYGGKEYWDSAA